MQQARSPQHDCAANAATDPLSSSAAAVILKNLDVMVNLSKLDECVGAVIHLVRRAPGDIGGTRSKVHPGPRPLPRHRRRRQHGRSRCCRMGDSTGQAAGGGAVGQALAPLQATLVVC